MIVAYHKKMKLLLIATIMVVSVFSLWSQGQVSEISLPMVEANRVVTLIDQPVQPLLPLAPTTVSVHAQGQMVISGADASAAFSGSQNLGNQVTESYWIMVTIPILTPSGISPGIGSVSPSSLTIQAVPEPSSFVLLAVGLFSGATIF